MSDGNQTAWKIVVREHAH